MQANRNDKIEVTLQENLCSYLALCNEIIDANQRRFPYVQIWRALEAEIARKQIEYSVKRGLETAKITATFIDLKFTIIPSPAPRKRPEATQKIDWHYMSNTLDKPAKFIANPALVDWNVKIDATVVQLFNQ